MERAIRYIEDNAEHQPSLEKVSEHVNLSPFHFQKMFKRWTGVSPKRYLQFITVENAKYLLSRSATVLDAAYDVGLSSPGRLHDLFVSVEAVTPGQYKTAGAGIIIRYGFHETPFGQALIAVSPKGITDLKFAEPGEENLVLRELQEKWAAAEVIHDRDWTEGLISSVFGEVMRDRRQDLVLRGTNFQIKVWHALLRIPEGYVVSYGDLARSIGRPEAVRAVAGAVARNPVAWLIPCHRVLRSTGEMGGYRWGIARKKMMLAREFAGQGY